MEIVVFFGVCLVMAFVFGSLIRETATKYPYIKE